VIPEYYYDIISLSAYQEPSKGDLATPGRRSPVPFRGKGPTFQLRLRPNPGFLPSFPSAGSMPPPRCRLTRPVFTCPFLFNFLLLAGLDWIAAGRLRATLPFLDGNKMPGWPDWPGRLALSTEGGGRRAACGIGLRLVAPNF